MRFSRRTRSAFTLIELLVVIGIIVLLLAILLPAVGRARQHANQVKCAANLRSIGQALTMYTQHYGYYPAALAYGGGNQFAIWPTRLRSFLNGDTGVFYCPSRGVEFEWNKEDTRPGPVAGDIECRFGYEPGERVLLNEHVTVKYYFSYGYNVFGSWQGAGWIREQARGVSHKGLGLQVDYILGNANPSSGEVRANRVRAPSEMIAIADSTGSGYGDFTISPVHEGMLPADLHRGGANVLFCDGHVQWYLRKELVRPPPGSGVERLTQWMPMQRMWNNDNGVSFE